MSTSAVISARRWWARIAGAAVLATAFGAGVAVAAPRGIGQREVAKGVVSDPISIDTREPTEIAIRLVTIAPGDTSDWHAHPGDKLMVVKSGTATYNDGNDPQCAARALNPEDAVFVPAGRAHLTRNQEQVAAELYVISFNPVGSRPATRVAKPGGCPE